jgi:nicotinate-nucleotide pyrophosphorylase (carboxylating)
MDDSVRELVARALSEDLGDGDITSQATVAATARAEATIVQKQPGVLFGLGVAAEVFSQAGIEGFEGLEPEGRWRDSVPAEVARVGGSARGLLAAERTALNLLCHLSGVATLTARFVEAVRGTDVVILDTRKTTPGLRALEKAAVAAGGGRNHRMGLDDAVLVKENHIALAGGLAEAVRRARAAEPGREVEVECRTVDEAAYALGTGAQRLLLDNMGPDELRRAVEARDSATRAGNHRAQLEASGGVTLGNVAEIAASGVDSISVGALTHSAPALDLSMLLRPAEAADQPRSDGG